MTYEENGFYYYKTKVHSFQLDQQKNLSIVAVSELLQEVAGTHANDFGFGYKNVIEKDLVWIITAMRVEIKKLPIWDEEITIKTWLVDINRYFSNRQFQILNKMGDVVISASTNWLLYNFKTRRPQNISSMNFNVKLHGDYLSVKKAVKTDKSTISEGVTSSITVKYSDLDMVSHMNNTRYFRSIIDSYNFDFHKTHFLKSFDIQFRNEAVYNDELEIFTKEISSNSFHHEIKKRKDSKSNCYCKLEWESL